MKYKDSNLFSPLTVEVFFGYRSHFGTGDDTKTDEFSEKFQMGKKCIWISENEGGGGKGSLELFRKFIRFFVATRP